MGDKLDRLWERVYAIRKRREGGHAIPIIRHLALRRHGEAMLELAEYLHWANGRRSLGRVSNPFSSAGLTYRAYWLGVSNAAQHMAMARFNVGDMAGYRHWIRRAARAGDSNADHEAKLFELRQPHEMARPLHRLRPWRF